MVQIVLVGLVAGVAGALLFLSPIGGTTLAFPLFILSGLPIAIAGLGWTLVAGLIASAVGVIVVFVAMSGPAAIVFLALFAGPIIWMARLAGLSRSDDATATVEWYPLGRILFHGTIVSAIGLVIVGFLIGFDPASISDEMVAALSDWLAQSPDVAAPPSVEDIEPFVRFNVAAMPFTVSAILVIVLVFNMWLAGRITDASGRLPRPRPPLWTAALPNEAVIVFAVAFAICFVPGAIGQAAGTLVGGFAAAFALIGLAVLHATTANNNLRTLILVTVYVVLVLFGFPILLLSVLGLLEGFLALRARKLRGAPPNT